MDVADHEIPTLRHDETRSLHNRGERRNPHGKTVRIHPAENPPDALIISTDAVRFAHRNTPRLTHLARVALTVIVLGYRT